MAMAYDSDSSAETTDFNTTLSYTHTVSGTPSFIVAATILHFHTAGAVPTCTGVTYGGDSMTEVEAIAGGSGTAKQHLSIWKLASPSSGNQTVTFTYSENVVARSGGTIALTGGGIQTASEEVEASSGTTSSLTLSTGNSDAIFVDAMYIGELGLSPSTGAEQTLRLSQLGTAARMAMSTAPGVSSQDMSWSWSTSGANSQVAILLADVASGVSDGVLPPTSFSDLEGGGDSGGGYLTGFGQAGVRGVLIPNPYSLTKSGIGLANNLNNLQVF